MSQRNKIYIFVFLLLIKVVDVLGHKKEINHGLNIKSVVLNILPKNPIVASFSAVILITMIPLILLKLLPSNIPKSIQNVLLAFAIGTVLGDVFLHMIPELMNNESHEHKNSHGHEHGHIHNENAINVSLYILLGILTFYILEKLVSLFGHEHENGHGHSHGHSHNHGKDGETSVINKIKSNLRNRKSNNSEKNKDDNTKSNKSTKINEKEKEKNIEKVDSSSHVKASMQIIASILHGFTDGISVTFAFLSSSSTGLSTSLAMFLHEIPHKFGDYTIMRQLGFSIKKSIASQFISALGTLSGSVFASLIYWMSSSTSSIPINELCQKYIMPITAGSLLYLALVGMLPELLQYNPKNGLKAIRQIFLESLSFCMGVYIMRWIALNE